MQEVEAASEHEEHDVWQGVQTLLISYVPAGHAARHASPRGLSLFEVHSVHVTAVPALVDDALREHFAQFSMPPLLVSLHFTQTFLLLLLVVGKNPSLHCPAATQLVVLPSVFRYRSPVHSVQVAGPAVLGFVHLAQPTTPVQPPDPVASPHETHFP